MSHKTITITHRPTGVVLAQGPLGWGVTQFEGNYYVSRRHLKDGIFKPNFIPGLCPYKSSMYGWISCFPMEAQKRVWAGCTGCPIPFSPSFGFGLRCRVIIQASVSNTAQVTIRAARLSCGPATGEAGTTPGALPRAMPHKR